MNCNKDSDKCYICLNAFEEQSVGSLDNCHHVFCLQCILRWSQTSNTCPVDRFRFSIIKQMRCPGGDLEKKIKVSPPKKEEDEEEEASSTVTCEECGRNARRHRLLMCTHCDSGYHMDCLTPLINTDPEGDWICPDCSCSAQQTGISMVEEEISDGELMDILAEADAMASTSSRLRPTPTNRSRSLTERRRSTRLKSRMSSNPGRQASWHVPKYLLEASRFEAPTNENVANHRSDYSCASVKLKRRRRPQI